jgi:hypothetical protein
VVNRDGVISETKNAVEPDRTYGSARTLTRSIHSTYLPKANARPGSLVASAKSWFLMVMSPMVIVSLETKPSIEPEPYWIENSEPLALYVDEAEESYFVCRKHAIDVH